MVPAKHEFFAVGHFSNDLEQKPHLGGGVSYSSVAMSRLENYSVNIITKASIDSPFLKDFSKFNVGVYRLNNKNQKLKKITTSFINRYDDYGKRRQIVTGIQENIAINDLENFPNIPVGSVILVAPIVGEVEVSLFEILAKKRILAVAPQGYFRKIEKDGIVTHRKWGEFDSLKFAKITSLSDEDITFDGKMDDDYLKQITKVCPVVVLTKGEKGLTIFINNKKINIKAFKLEKEERKDLTGAGDVCASAFIWHYLRWKEPKEAGAFAALYAGLKIKGISKEREGVGGLPFFEEIKEFCLNNPERIRFFYKENGLSVPTFFGGRERK